MVFSITDIRKLKDIIQIVSCQYICLWSSRSLFQLNVTWVHSRALNLQSKSIQVPLEYQVIWLGWNPVHLEYPVGWGFVRFPLDFHLNQNFFSCTEHSFPPQRSFNDEKISDLTNAICFNPITYPIIINEDIYDLYLHIQCIDKTLK